MLLVLLVFVVVGVVVCACCGCSCLSLLLFVACCCSWLCLLFGVDILEWSFVVFVGVVCDFVVCGA